MTVVSGENLWPDLAGRLEGGRHVLPVRVYFEDTDFSGVVYHTSYLRWCERGRSDFLRLKGLSHAALHAAEAGPSAAFAVRRLTAEYLKPARIDDVLEVETAVTSVTKASLIMTQTVARAGIALCKAEVQCVLVSASGAIQRLPPVLTELLSGSSA
jgi:acyl-CoA thioester hydrolase